MPRRQFFRALGLRFWWIQDVRRRNIIVFLQINERFDQRGLGVVIECEQPAASDRRKGNRRKQLRIIVETVAAVGVGPSPVEDILAVGMTFQVQGQGGAQLILAPQSDELRLPAGRC